MTLAVQDKTPRGEVGLLTQEGLDQSAKQLALLENYVKMVLRKDEDYGVIPGTGGKPTLLKPGAANVIAAFNCYPDPHIETETVEPDTGFVFYRVRVDIIRQDTGERRASGIGSCSSYETKYRYRNAQPVCPQCNKENIRRSKNGGFYCWAKTGGCGANFHHDDAAITGQTVGKVVNEDPLEQANTILKMATKRAEVDAALRLPGVARFFTQDLEDIAQQPEEEPASPQPQERQRPQNRPTPAPRTPAEAPARPAQPVQVQQAATASNRELSQAIADGFEALNLTTEAAKRRWVQEHCPFVPDDTKTWRTEHLQQVAEALAEAVREATPATAEQEEEADG